GVCQDQEGRPGRHPVGPRQGQDGHGDAGHAEGRQGHRRRNQRDHASCQAFAVRPAGRAAEERSAAARVQGRDRRSQDGQGDARTFRNQGREEGPGGRRVRGVGQWL
ncbi:MAG: LSU ribosomal protein L24p (L26e), partial [uncultured Sphingomonadaceae bacterium]